MLLKYQPQNAFKIPANLRENKWQWTPLFVDYIAILSNKEKLQTKGLYAPDTWEELLQPELKNEIALVDFFHGGRGYGMITSLWQVKGEDYTIDYATKFNKQNVLLTETEEKAVTKVMSGEKTIAIVSLIYALRLESQYKNLFATLLKDANKNYITGIALLNSKNLITAQEFVDYLLSEQAQNALAEAGVPRLWRASDYTHDDGRKLFVGENLPVAIDDLSWTAGQKEHIIRQWLEAK